MNIDRAEATDDMIADMQAIRAIAVFEIQQLQWTGEVNIEDISALSCIIKRLVAATAQAARSA